MRNRYYAIVTLLIVGHLFTEVHTFIRWVKPETVTVYVDNWFIKPKFTVFELTILWYSKIIEDCLLVMALLVAGACQAFSRNYNSYLEWQRYSFRLYILWCIYFLYHIFDTLSFFYNYKSSHLLYVIVLILATGMAAFVGFYKIKKH